MGNLAKRFPIYSRLVWLYPSPYKQQYAQQMLQTLGDMLDGAATKRQRAAIWMRTALDFPLSLSKQQFIYVGGTILHEMPLYIKRSSLIGGLLIAPFFILMLLASLTHHRLYHSVFWHVSVLFTWLILLPALALIINTAAFLRWYMEHHAQTYRKGWRGLFDLLHNWPSVSIVVISFAILALAFGHDSVHCIAGNPVRELNNWHHTWLCLQQKTQ